MAGWIKKFCDGMLGKTRREKPDGAAEDYLETGFWDYLAAPLREFKLGFGDGPPRGDGARNANARPADTPFVHSRIDWERYARIEQHSIPHKN